MREFLFLDRYPTDPEGEDVITDHRYDAGWPRNDKQGCIYAGHYRGEPDPPCGEPEHVHELSEYPSQRPARNEGQEHRPQVDAGHMHEPKPYTGELDWEDDGRSLVHPYID